MTRLIIAPHVDDDVIGCGGTMGPNDVVLYLGVDKHHVVSREGRLLEAQRAAALAGHSFIWPVYDGDYKPGVVTWLASYECFRQVNCYAFPVINSLITDIETWVNEINPDEVVLPWPSYNQDHRATYDAAMVALRPHDKNHFVKRVMLYEEPDCFWPHLGAGAFVPTYFRQIDWKRKREMYETMPSQIRGHRDPEHLFALATIRGAAIMVPFAEAYHVLRWVE